MNICKSCEFKKYLKGYGTYCTKCLCILDAKTRVKDSKCPLGKW